MQAVASNDLVSLGNEVSLGKKGLSGQTIPSKLFATKLVVYIQLLCVCVNASTQEYRVMFEEHYENSGKFFLAVKLSIVFWHCTNNEAIHLGISLSVKLF